MPDQTCLPAARDAAPIRARARRRIAKSASALVLSILLSACLETSPAGPVLPLVPPEAFAVVLVDSPQRLFSASSALWEAADLSSASGADLEGLLRSSLPDPDAALKALDFARPWAMAFVPLDGGSKEVRSLFYVPYRSRPEEYAAKLVGSSFKLVADSGGYAVFSDKEGPVAFPPADPIDLSRLTRYPAASVKLWADPEAIRRQVADGYVPIREAIRDLVTGAGEADPLAAAKDLALGLLAQLKAADAALVPSASGLTIRVGCAAESGGWLEEALADAASSPSALDWAARLSADSLYAFAWSLEPAVAADISSRFMDPFMGALGLGEKAAERIKALQERGAEATGPRGAMTMDMDIDMDALGAIRNGDPADMAALIGKALDLRLEMTQEAKDEAMYRELMRTSGSDPDIRDFLESYSDALGLSISLENEDKKDGDFSYGELSVAVEISDPSKFGPLGEAEVEIAESTLRSIGQLLTMRWTVSNGRFYGTMGDAEALKALSRRSAAKDGLDSEPVFADFAKGIPGKPLIVGAVSAARLMSLAARAAAAGGQGAAMPDPERFGRWLFYMSAEGSTGSAGADWGFFVPAGDIGALIELSGVFKKGGAEPGA